MCRVEDGVRVVEAHLSTTMESQVVSAMTIPKVAMERKVARVGAEGRTKDAKLRYPAAQSM